MTTMMMLMILCISYFDAVIGDHELCQRECTVDDGVCTQEVCDDGYVDKTGGHTKWWACGVSCPGGKYYTDGYCNCACIEASVCHEEHCSSRGPCNAGYMDKTDGNWNRWACGVNCPGGKYYTDGACNCACVDAPDVCAEGQAEVCEDQGPCNAGYMDVTQGKANWWACGVNCPGGKYWTDGVCNCACKPAGQCAMVPSYYNFNIYRYFPALSFIRTIGVVGDYLVIITVVAILVLLTVYCYKRNIARNKMKYKVVSLEDSASEAENTPINQ